MPFYFWYLYYPHIFWYIENLEQKTREKQMKYKENTINVLNIYQNIYAQYIYVQTI